MTREDIYNQIIKKKSFLCIGLDTDIRKIPEIFLEHSDPVFEFNKKIIDATKDYCIGYKINTAFYEAQGDRGWRTLYKTVNYIPQNLFKIADAKRGDIGNTVEQYAEAFFKHMNFDAVTVAPYMGEDSVAPFLKYKKKWVIILALTSNPGSNDFQLLKVGKEYLFEKVVQKVKSWGTPDNTMLVVGATHPKFFTKIRKCVPDHFILVPGIGAQGGEISEVCNLGMNKKVGLIVNASRSIIYASEKKDYLTKATKAAYQLQREMELILQDNKLV